MILHGVLLYLRKYNGYRGAFANGAFNFDLGIVYFSRVLYYRQTQTRSADLMRTALINPIEPLEYTFRTFGRYPYSRVGNGQQHRIILVFYGNLDRTALVIVFNGVVAKVKDHGL